MANKFVSFLSKAGQLFSKGLDFALKYDSSVAAVAIAVDPAAAPIITAIETGFDTSLHLIKAAVVAVEQKWAAAGNGIGSGQQKAADVLTIVGPAVLKLLEADGVKVDGGYVQNLIKTVADGLNLKPSNALDAAAAAVPAK